MCVNFSFDDLVTKASMLPNKKNCSNMVLGPRVVLLGRRVGSSHSSLEEVMETRHSFLEEGMAL